MGDLFESILSSAKAQTETSLSKKRGRKPADEDIIGEWASIPNPKLSAIPYHQKPTSQWGTKDLFYFFQDQFKELTGEEFVVGFIPGQQNILLLQDAMAKQMPARPTAAETKEYIEWFLANRAMGLITRYNCFKMKFMYASFEIERYLNQRNGAVKKVEGSRKIKDTAVFSADSMESVYLANPENFVLKYGLVLSTIWLMRKRGMDESQAIRAVSDDAVRLCEKGKYNELVAATEKHNPYPIWCKFAGLSRMLADLSERTGEFFDIINTRFSQEANKFSFLDGKE